MKRLKKVVAAGLSAALVVSGTSGLTAFSAVETGVTINIDGARVEFTDQEPLIIDDVTMVPVRGVFERLGAEVEYIDPDMVDIIYRDNERDIRIRFTIGSNSIEVVRTYSDGTEETENVELENATVLTENDRTLAPLRFVSETLGCEVNWDGDTYTVDILTNGEPESAPSASPSPSVPTASSETDGEIVNAEIQTDNRMAFTDDALYYVGDDGTVWCGSTAEEDAQYSQVEGMSDIVAVDCGLSTMYALDRYGNVYAWGDNRYGQAGSDTGERVDSPRRIEGLSGIVKLSAGGYFAVALDGSGDIYAWGLNTKGQLGNGTTENSAAPVKVESDVKFADVAAGLEHVAAAAENGRVFTWGSNGSGQLGIASRNVSYRAEPTQAQNMYNITSVAAGDEQSLALRRDGTVYMWGTTYIGFCDEEIAAHDTAQDGEDSENVIIADEYGYYRFPEPTRVRKIYWDQDERDYMVSVLTDITAIACGKSGSAFISAGRAYALGNTPLAPGGRSRQAQLMRFYAQEYSQIEADAVYCGNNNELYIINGDGLWRIDGSGRTRIEIG